MTITINKAGVTIDGTPYAVPDGDAPLVEKLAAALEAVVAGSDEQSITLLSLASEAQQRERTARERTEKVRGQLAEEQIEWGRAQIAASCFESTLIRVEGALGGGNPDDDYSGPSVPEKLFRLLNEYPDINREWDNNPYADVPNEACRQYSERETLKRQLEEEREQVKYARIIIFNLDSYLVRVGCALRGDNPEDDILVSLPPKNLKDFSRDDKDVLELIVQQRREYESKMEKLKKALASINEVALRQEPLDEPGASVNPSKPPAEVSDDYITRVGELIAGKIQGYERRIEFLTEQASSQMKAILEIAELVGAEQYEVLALPSVVVPMVQRMAQQREETNPDIVPNHPLSYAIEAILGVLSENGEPHLESDLADYSINLAQWVRWCQTELYHLAEVAGIPKYGTPDNYQMLFRKLKEIVAGVQIRRFVPYYTTQEEKEREELLREYAKLKINLDGLRQEYAEFRKEHAELGEKLAAKSRGYDGLKKGVYGLAQAAGIPTDDVPADYELTLLGQLEDAVTSKTGARLKKAQADIRGLKTQAKGLKTRVHSLEAELEEARERERTLIDQYEPPDDDYTR